MRCETVAFAKHCRNVGCTLLASHDQGTATLSIGVCSAVKQLT